MSFVYQWDAIFFQGPTCRYPRYSRRSACSILDLQAHFCRVVGQVLEGSPVLHENYDKW